jgi:hypothetical protein
MHTRQFMRLLQCVKRRMHYLQHGRTLNVTTLVSRCICSHCWLLTMRPMADALKSSGSLKACLNQPACTETAIEGYRMRVCSAGPGAL